MPKFPEEASMKTVSLTLVKPFSMAPSNMKTADRSLTEWLNGLKYSSFDWIRFPFTLSRCISGVLPISVFRKFNFSMYELNETEPG